jgi:hypothetical protein
MFGNANRTDTGTSTTVRATVRRLTPGTMQLGIDHSHRESLVKVHMANITAAGGRVREANLSIQIRSIEVYLTTVCVDDITCLLDAVLEYTEGRWVCDLGDEISPGTSDVPGVILTMKAARLPLCCSAFTRRSAMSRLPSGKLFTGTTFKPAMAADFGRFSAQSDSLEQFTHRRIGPMCADRDEADIPMTLTTRFVISSDDAQTRVFASSSRVWL